MGISRISVRALPVPDCGISIDEIEPRSFSFNNPFGACPSCFGLGYKMEFDVDLMIPDKSLSIQQGAITVLGWQSCTDKGSFTRAILDALARNTVLIWIRLLKNILKRSRISCFTEQMDTRSKCTTKDREGEGVYDVAFEGLIKNVERRYRDRF